jgi:hypothetical protein
VPFTRLGGCLPHCPLYGNISYRTGCSSLAKIASSLASSLAESEIRLQEAKIEARELYILLLLLYIIAHEHSNFASSNAESTG